MCCHIVHKERVPLTRVSEIALNGRSKRGWSDCIGLMEQNLDSAGGNKRKHRERCTQMSTWPNQKKMCDCLEVPTTSWLHLACRQTTLYCYYLSSISFWRCCSEPRCRPSWKYFSASSNSPFCVASTPLFRHITTGSILGCSSSFFQGRVKAMRGAVIPTSDFHPLNRLQAGLGICQRIYQCISVFREL